MIEIEIWEKQKGETTKSYDAFMRYRELGYTRSIQKVSQMYANETGRRVNTIAQQLKRWSVKYDWVKRAEAWDLQQDKIYQAENQEKLKNMRERHLTYEAVKQQKGFDRIRQIIPEDLDPKEALLFLDSGIRGERTLHGEPESTLGVTEVRKVQKLRFLDQMNDEDEAS